MTLLQRSRGRYFREEILHEWFVQAALALGRGLHSSTFRFNVNALCGIGGAFRRCLGGA